jgi:hypothetical protein
MRTTSIEWPEAALGCPLRGSFRALVQSRFAAASLNPGIGTYGADRMEEVRVHEVGFVWSLAQLADFEEFHDVTLSRGMRWFMFKVPVAGLVVPTYSHIEGGYRVTDTDGWTAVNFTIQSFRRVGNQTT